MDCVNDGLSESQALLMAVPAHGHPLEGSKDMDLLPGILQICLDSQVWSVVSHLSNTDVSLEVYLSKQIATTATSDSLYFQPPKMRK
jgi:hypothetical protein